LLINRQLEPVSLQQLEAIIARFSAMKAGWDESVTLERMRSDLDNLHSRFAPVAGFRAQAITENGVAAEWVEATASRPALDRVILYLHGGGFAVGSLAASRHFASHLAAAAQARVLVVGYRLAPEHVFPAQIEDTLTAYRWLLSQGYLPERIIVAGDSAGGALVLASLSGLAQGATRLPSCAVLLTPWVDMRCGGETYATNRDKDPVANREMAQMMAGMYLGENGKVDDPRATPVLGSFAGFPPMLIQAAGRDVFLDDARATHAHARRAGVDSELDEWPDMIHQWQLYAAELDEGQRAIERMATFIQRHVG
jgi:monoterpene epsilon-lactone hydrolase